MPLEDMVEEIRGDAEARYRKAIADANAEAQRIAEEAETGRREYADARAKQAAREAARRIGVASLRSKLEAKRIVDKAKAEAAGTAIEGMRASLPAFTKTQEYAQLLQKMVDSAAKEIGKGGTVRLKADDAAKVKAPAGISVESGADVAGGMTASSKDGTRTVDYSLGRLLDENMDALMDGLVEGIGGEDGA